MIVYPANEDVRAKIKHPNGVAFRDTLDQGVEWPPDTFTMRRLLAGTILEQPAAQQLQSKSPPPRTLQTQQDK